MIGEEFSKKISLNSRLLWVDYDSLIIYSNLLVTLIKGQILSNNDD